MKGLLIAAALLCAGSVCAQTTNCYTTGSPAAGYTTTCQPPVADYSWLTQPSRQAAQAAGQQAGALVNRATQKPHVMAVSAVLECGVYKLVTMTYSNGTQTQDRIEDPTPEYQSKLAGALAGIRAQGGVVVSEQNIAPQSGSCPSN